MRGMTSDLRRTLVALALLGGTAIGAFELGALNAAPAAPGAAASSGPLRAPAPETPPEDPAAGAAAGRPGALSQDRAPEAAAPRDGAVPKVTPELVARVTQQARERLEAVREQLAARCVPDARGERGGVRVTMNLTFDASGREIARGIGENRRAPAGAAGACLRLQRDVLLSVPPPGTNVGVSVPLTLP